MTRLNLNTFNLKTIEKTAVISAINYTKGNVQYARELLNVSRSTIYKLLKEYKVDYNKIREDNNWNHKGYKVKK